jgi:AcrR family transcriptional regulator
MSPRLPDPDIAARLLEVAARLLATEGEAAVSARRVAREAGASTMAVYTYYGGMDELLAAVRREGFRRFGLELERPTRTADPVADVMAQGWAYRHFALADRHLYEVMFRSRLADPATAAPEDADASMATFLSLVHRIERCASVGPWLVDDAVAAAEVVWAAAHGHCMIELSGYHETVGRDPVASFGRCLLHLAIGFGQDPAAARAALARSRTRARRAGQLA